VATPDVAIGWTHLPPELTDPEGVALPLLLLRFISGILPYDDFDRLWGPVKSIYY
jgi:hypothetical protein